EYPKTSGQSLRLARRRGQGPQGHRRAGASLGGAARKLRKRPLRGITRIQPDRSRWARGRTRTVAAALVKGEVRRRTGSTRFWRGWYRQIAAHGRATRTASNRAACTLAPFLLAAAHR